MKIKNPFFLIISISVIVLMGGLFMITATTQSTPQVKVSSLAKADVLTPTSFDWGNIDYSGPKVTKAFSIKNIGSDVLQLYNIHTSCHCTKAYVTINGEVSPEFGMDMGGDVSSYIGKVNPGQKADITVVFDPAYHGPEGVGPINRYVNVDTNDKGQPHLTFTLTGVVIKK